MRNKYYKRLIFTNHALDRMQYRRVSQEAVWRVLQHPDRVEPEEKPGSYRFIRILRGRQYQIIGVHLANEKKTLIISVWVRGEEDRPSLWWLVLRWPLQLLWRIVIGSVKLLGSLLKLSVSK